jgi:two-component system OmpR family response regulator
MDNVKTEKILIIEDDIQLTLFIKSVLERDGYHIKVINNGTDGLKEALNNIYSLVLLDVNLPGMDGVTLCRNLRNSSQVPVIIFTAQNKIYEKVAGLDAGANDYITKPVEVPELLARVRAHLRIQGKIKLKALQPVNGEIERAPSLIAGSINELLIFNNLKLNSETREVLRENRVIHLSPKEFEILFYFMKNPYKTLTKQQVFEEVWQCNFNNFSDKRVVDEHINKLRKKIHLSDLPKVLHTIYGVGHILK